ncbi:MAG: nucleotidyltransferase domain-containing protein [Bacteroidota bacterium]
MTIADLKAQNLILFECISGSKAYGLDLPHSDTDIKGVFIIPEDQLYGSRYVAQVANPTNDEVYYELGRFVELLKKNNPNILELLGTPPDKVLHRDALLDQLQAPLFLTRKCKDTFGGFAFTQIKKARGLNKKIVNPVDQQKKNILAFCYVLYGQGSIPLHKWLEIHGVQQEDCGLVNIPHMKDIYGLYTDPDKTRSYKGILRKENATAPLLSSIPKGELPAGHLYFNKDGYTKYCKDYRDYWHWVEQRNDARYAQTIAHGKNYDAKNMMHTFRLLDMAKEILEHGEIIVQRPNRAELLSIRKGEWEYDQLIAQAQAKMAQVEKAHENSVLPDQIDEDHIEDLLVRIRRACYEKGIGR